MSMHTLPNGIQSPRRAQADQSLPLSEVVFCVVDTETTGFDHQEDAVVEVAGVHMTLMHGVSSHGSWLVDPKRPIPPDATEVHGLTDRDVAGAGTLAQAMEYIQAHGFQVWAAHNARFDFGFIPAGNRPVLCTLRLARRLWPELPAHGNQALREHFKLVVPGADGLPAHRAEPDALVTAELLRIEIREVMDRYPAVRTLGDLLYWMGQPFLLPVCQLGKAHRGKPWSEVPREFMAWALEHYADLDLDQTFTLRHYLEQFVIEPSPTRMKATCA